MTAFPNSLVDIAENEIRKLIIQGDLALGQRVTEAELAQRFGMSKTPVHEALQHLQREGLVQVRPRQGTFIFTFTEEQARALRGVRKVLECYAIQEAMRKNRGRLLRSISENIKQTIKVWEERKIQPYHVLDKEFHNTFFAYADNTYLNAAFSAIAIKLQVLWRLSVQESVFTIEHMEGSVSDHRRIAEALIDDRLDDIPGLLDIHFHRAASF